MRVRLGPGTGKSEVFLVACSRVEEEQPDATFFRALQRVQAEPEGEGRDSCVPLARPACLVGIDDWVATPFILDPADGPFSVFAWIKGGAPGQVIISQRDTTDGRTTNPGSTWLGIYPSYGKLITALMDPQFGVLRSEAVITDGQWYHVGLVYDFNGIKRYLYVDGAEVANDTEALGRVSSHTGLSFGVGPGIDLDAASFFSGLIDDVRIYNRVVRPW